MAPHCWTLADLLRVGRICSSGSACFWADPCEQFRTTLCGSAWAGLLRIHTSRSTFFKQIHMSRFALFSANLLEWIRTFFCKFTWVNPHFFLRIRLSRSAFFSADLLEWICTFFWGFAGASLQYFLRICLSRPALFLRTHTYGTCRNPLKICIVFERYYMQICTIIKRYHMQICKPEIVLSTCHAPKYTLRQGVVLSLLPPPNLNLRWQVVHLSTSCFFVPSYFLNPSLIYKKNKDNNNSNNNKRKEKETNNNSLYIHPSSMFMLFT